MKRYIYVLIGFFMLAGCSKDGFLERKPLVNINDADYWTSVNDLRLYVNSFYNDDGLLPSRRAWGTGPYTIDAGDGSDTNVPFNYNRRMNGEGTVPSSGGGWSISDWTPLRNINYFMDNYTKVAAPLKDVQPYIGEALFFRSVFYYDKLRKFGALPWASTSVGTGSELLFSARLPRNQVVDSILLDLDNAISYLPERAGGSWSGRITKEVALALKARVALYEGTWEKYHGLKNTPFKVDGSDGTKFLTAAATASGDLIALGEKNGYPRLDNVGIENGYWLLFNQKDYATSKEVLFWRKYSAADQVTHTWTRYSINGSGMGLSKDMVDSYLCLDGKPIALSPLYAGDRTLKDVVKNRDPRLNQTINVDDNKHVKWYATGQYFTTPTIEVNGANNTSTGYQVYKGHTGDFAENNAAQSTQGYVHFRFAEVLLIHAEAKAELGTITQSDIDKTINALRLRVGMSGGLLQLAAIATDPNREFPSLSPVLNEIRRERKVELAAEWYRVDDLFRWAVAEEKIAGKRPLGAYKKQWEHYPGATAPFNTALAALPVNADGYIDPFKTYSVMNNGYHFNLGRDYLLPIPTNELTLNPKLKQNPGW